MVELEQNNGQNTPFNSKKTRTHGVTCVFRWCGLAVCAVSDGLDLAYAPQFQLSGLGIVSMVDGVGKITKRERERERECVCVCERERGKIMKPTADQSVLLRRGL